MDDGPRSDDSQTAHSYQ